MRPDEEAGANDEAADREPDPNKGAWWTSGR
jgi:hypothetical protein